MQKYSQECPGSYHSRSDVLCYMLYHQILVRIRVPISWKVSGSTHLLGFAVPQLRRYSQGPAGNQRSFASTMSQYVLLKSCIYNTHQHREFLLHYSHPNCLLCAIDSCPRGYSTQSHIPPVYNPKGASAVRV